MKGGREGKGRGRKEDESSDLTFMTTPLLYLASYLITARQNVQMCLCG